MPRGKTVMVNLILEHIKVFIEFESSKKVTQLIAKICWDKVFNSELNYVTVLKFRGEIIGRVAGETIMVDTSELAHVTEYHDK